MTTAPAVTPATERFQTAMHLLLYAAGYAPLKTWAAGKFLFVSFTSEDKAREAITTFQRARGVVEAELKHEADGSPYIVVRY